MTKRIATLACVLMLGACGSDSSTPAEPVDINAEARRIAMSSIIVDTHIDVPYRLVAFPDDISQRTETGDFDYPRAVAGGLNAPFMSIYTPAALEAEGRSREMADSLIDLVEGIVAGAPQKFAVARTVADVRRHFESGIMSFARCHFP